MKKSLTLLFILFGSAWSVNTMGQNCNNVILSDSYSSTANWQSQGNGNVNIANGKCNFVNAYCGSYNRVYQSLNTTLSNNYWRSQCEYSITSSNPSGNGTGAIIMALTAGTLDFRSYDASQGYANTNQDGLALLIVSPTTTDNNINNWFFRIEQKKGTVYTILNSSVIYANSSITNYYTRLERTSTNNVQLSIYTDPNFTIHLSGSPITIAIDPTVTGLNTIQHGVATNANASRLINATIDNLSICESGAITNNCNNTIFTDDYSTPLNWQSQGNGNVNVNNGKCNFVNAYCGSYNRVYHILSTTLSDNYWSAKCDYSITNGNPSGNGTGAIIMALTAGTLDFRSYDASQGYANTNQDGVALLLVSPTVSDNNIDNWFFRIEQKKGTVNTILDSVVIYASSAIMNYYPKFTRKTKGTIELSIYSDQSFITHLPGSPILISMDTSITGLNTIQHGVATNASASRVVNAFIDNILICQDEATSIGNLANENSEGIIISPNPFISNISISGVNKLYEYKIYDLLGHLILYNETTNLNINNLESLNQGIYLLQIKTKID